MAANELSLITFTILAQIACGAFFTIRLVNFFAVRHAGAREADRLIGRLPAACALLMILGMLVSFLHLGNPINAPKTILNLDTSWLSREILTALIFTGLIVLYTLLQRRKAGSSGLGTAVAWCAVAAGLALMYVMPKAYSALKAQPAWNTPTIPLSFFMTALLLGVLAVASGMSLNFITAKGKYPKNSEVQSSLLSTTLQWSGTAAIVFAGIELAIIPAYLVSLTGTGVPAALQTVHLLAGPLFTGLALRIMLLIFGAMVLGALIVANSRTSGKERMVSYLAGSAFILVLIAEIIGRYIFYASRVGIAPHVF